MLSPDSAIQSRQVALFPPALRVVGLPVPTFRFFSQFGRQPHKLSASRHRDTNSNHEPNPGVDISAYISSLDRYAPGPAQAIGMPGGPRERRDGHDLEGVAPCPDWTHRTP